MANELLAPAVVGEILELDSTLQRILRNSWPEGWLADQPARWLDAGAVRYSGGRRPHAG